MIEKILGKPLDEAFPYQTERNLLIRDFILSLIGNLFSLLVIVYTLFYVFIRLEKYNESFVSTGYAVYKVSGKAYSENKSSIEVWDNGDLLYPEQDSKGIMLGIAVSEIKGQQMGYCTIACVLDSDCPNDPPVSYPNCLTTGYCNATTWCPNADSNSTDKTQIELQGVEDFLINIWAGINFASLNSPDYTSYRSKSGEKYPHPHATLFRVGDVLKKSGINDINSINSTGTIIEFRFNWNCDSSKDSCDPNVEFTNVGDSSYPIFYK
jgi:ATP P2X receptor